MVRTCVLSIMISVWGLGVRTFADQPAPCFPKQANLCCKCPETYCPKPFPATPCPPHCWCADNYCPKPLPSVCFKTPWCVDDYCPKPLPKIFHCCPHK
jgi:hypothetical protein